MNRKKLPQTAENGLYINQKEAMELYGVGFRQMKRLREEKIIAAYRHLSSNKEIYYEKKELEDAFCRMFLAEDEDDPRRKRAKRGKTKGEIF